MSEDNAMGRVPVKFKASWGVYVTGDIAGFELGLAKQLVAAGVATDDLEADVGAAAPGAGEALVAMIVAEKDAKIAELEAALESALTAAAKAKPGKADAGAGAPPQQGAAGASA